MDIIQPYTINSEAEVKAYLADVLATPGNRSMHVVETHCDRPIVDPAIRAYFLATGKEMLAELNRQR